jgi:PhoH-like ATPase
MGAAERPNQGQFKVVAKHDLNGVDATKVFQDGKNDHQIINAALTLQRQHKDRKVVLVSKDVALRLKAKSLNIIAEDYLTGKVRDLGRNLFTGLTVQESTEEAVIDTLFKHGQRGRGGPGGERAAGQPLLHTEAQARRASWPSTIPARGKCNA